MSSEGDILSPLARGRSRFKKADYKGALEAFSEAVEATTAHMRVQSLDYRAATYEKLHQTKARLPNNSASYLKLALQDSKEMMELLPQSSKGYLRCGKILRLLDQEDVAFKIYERGLKKVVPGTDADRGTLQSQYNTLYNARRPKKDLDFVPLMPQEILEMIFSQLNLRSRLRCLVVSKTWGTLLRSTHGLWLSLDTRVARGRPMSLDQIKKFCKLSNYRVNHVNVDSKILPTKRKLLQLVSLCQDLQHLEISRFLGIGAEVVEALEYAHNLRTVSITGLRGHCVVELLRVCNLLSSARFWNVSWPLEFPKQDIWRPQNPYLTELVVSSEDRIAEYGNMGYVAIEVPPIGPDRVRTLDLQNLITSFPNLKTLKIGSFVIINVPNDAASWGAIEHLAIPASVIDWPFHFPHKLKSLNINACRLTLPDFGIPDIICDLPLLQEATVESVVADDISLPMFTCSSPSYLRQLLGPSLRAGNLKVLSIANDAYVEDRNWMEFLPGDPREEFPSIIGLSVSGLNFREEMMVEYLNRFPNLKCLNIAHTQATGSTIRHLVDRGVKHMQVYRSDITSSACDYAEAHGCQLTSNTDMSYWLSGLPNLN